MSKQISSKSRVKSTRQKRSSSRHDFEAIPATRPVAGAFGREGRDEASRKPSRGAKGGKGAAAARLAAPRRKVR